MPVILVDTPLNPFLLLLIFANNVQRKYGENHELEDLFSFHHKKFLLAKEISVSFFHIATSHRIFFISWKEPILSVRCFVNQFDISFRRVKSSSDIGTCRCLSSFAFMIIITPVSKSTSLNFSELLKALDHNYKVT